MKNTRITYLYRDGCNYKQHQEVVVTGSLTRDQISPYLDGGLWFIAGQVGLPEPQLEWEAEGYAYPSEDDHVWCELNEGAVEPTDAAPTLAVTADELLARFRASGGNWDEQAAIERLGLDCRPARPARTRIVRIGSTVCPEYRVCVEVPADASEEQLRRLAARVACHREPLNSDVRRSPLTVEEVAQLDLRFWLGTRGHWHLMEDLAEQTPDQGVTHGDKVAVAGQSPVS